MTVVETVGPVISGNNLDRTDGPDSWLLRESSPPSCPSCGRIARLANTQGSEMGVVAWSDLIPLPSPCLKYGHGLLDIALSTPFDSLRRSATVKASLIASYHPITIPTPDTFHDIDWDKENVRTHQVRVSDEMSPQRIPECLPCRMETRLSR